MAVPLSGGKQGAEDFNESGFACSVGSKKPEEFAFFYVEVEVVDGVDREGFAVKAAAVWGFGFECFCQVDCLDGILVLQQ